MKKHAVFVLVIFALLAVLAMPMFADSKDIVRGQATPTSGPKELTGTANNFVSITVDSIGNSVDCVDQTSIFAWLDVKSGSTVLRHIQITTGLLYKVIDMGGVYCKPCSYDAGGNTVTVSAKLRNN